MSNEIKKLEQDVVNAENKLKEYLFSLFDDSGKIRQAFQEIKNNTNLEVDEVANVVLSIARLEIELSELEQKHLFSYMKTKGYRIEHDFGTVYSVYCIADYDFFVDMTKTHDSIDFNYEFGYYRTFSNNGDLIDMVSDEWPQLKMNNCMIRKFNKEIIFSGK